MDMLTITIAGIEFEARLETELAPATCAAVLSRLPMRDKAIHVRWSGQAVWVPFGAEEFGVGFENATSYPAPGEIILYPGGVSETEMLIAYGSVSFASKAGPLAGNHFMTIVSNQHLLQEVGRRVLWEGAQDIEVRR